MTINADSNQSTFNINPSQTNNIKKTKSAYSEYNETAIKNNISHNTDSLDNINTQSNDSNHINQASKGDKNLDTSNYLVLNELIEDDSIEWKVHNCKIVDYKATTNEKLPFIYHYDALPEEIKKLHPLNSQLLKYFDTPMSVADAAKLLNVDESLIKTPWQVKITGTLVMYSERLQIALRLKFTNTIKELDPIYTQQKEDAIKTSMQHWIFYDDVFVLNKNSKTLVVTSEDVTIQMPFSNDYQILPEKHAMIVQTLLENQKSKIPQLEEAINLRLM